MAHLNSGVAYDLSGYQALPKKQPKPGLKVVKSKNRLASSVVTPKTVCSFAIIVTMIVLIVFNQAQLNEVSGDINELNASMEKLQSENVRMTSELESTISLRNIADQAKNKLGMNKLDRYQTEYIYLFQTDKIELTDESPAASIGERLRLTITGAIQRLQEYIAN